jgi:hypothetical protein
LQAAVVDKWFQKGPPTALEFDDRFQYYTRTILEVENMAMTKDQDFVRVYNGPLADGIKSHARQWIQSYGQKLQETASQELKALQEELKVRNLATVDLVGMQIGRPLFVFKLAVSCSFPFNCTSEML